MEKNLTFGELRVLLDRLARYSICMKETQQYENFVFLETVPETYDKYYVYGIGMIDSEFYQKNREVKVYEATGTDDELVYAPCIEIMLSEQPKSDGE